MKYVKNLLLTAAVVSGIGFGAAGCSTKLSPEPFNPDTRLTAGQVKTKVKTGVTTSLEVFKALGAPNVVALEDGKGEVWTYDQIKVRRLSQGYSAGGNFSTFFGLGGDVSRNNIGKGVGAGGAAVAAGADTVTTAIQTATLIIRFDANEKVSSYKMLVTSF